MTAGLLAGLAVAVSASSAPARAAAAERPAATPGPGQVGAASASLGALISGVVSDPSGALIEGSVLLVSPLVPDGNPARAATLRTARTGRDGTFRVEGMSHGIYRVTAVAPGYLASVTRLNTLLRNTVDIMLRPAEPPDPELAESGGWMLRLPPRDLLRDLEAPAVAARLGSPPGPPGSRERTGGIAAPSGRPSSAVTSAAASGTPELAAVPVDGEFRHWFSGEAPGSAADPAVADSSGSATSVRLAMRVSDRLDLEVAGAREREDVALAPGLDLAERVTSKDRLGVSVGYELDDRSHLDMQAAYDRHELDFDAGGSGVYEPAGRNVTRSARTAWSTGLGERTSLDMAATYVDSTVDWSASETGAVEPATGRLWRAGGEITTPFGEEHRMSFGLRARVLELEGGAGEWTALTGVSAPLGLAGPGPDGWAFHLRGREAWDFTRSITLDLGIDYYRSLSVREGAHLVPEAGATLRLGSGATLQGSVSYLADTTNGTYAPGAGLPAPGDAPERSRERLGFALRFDTQPTAATRVSLRAARRPVSFEFDERGSILPDLDHRPLYVSDGEAASEELGVEAARRFGGSVVTLGSRFGRVNGRYAASLIGEPLWQTRGGQLRYVATSLSGANAGTGTELHFEMRNLRESSEGLETGEVRLTGLSVWVAQSLPFLEIRDTSWRLMLAYQGTLDGLQEIDGARGAEGPDASGEGGSSGPRRLLAAGNRLSGGVSVQF